MLVGAVPNACCYMFNIMLLWPAVSICVVEFLLLDHFVYFGTGLGKTVLSVYFL